ncbi:hypothetical protein EYF80_027003 [Liparis tanakae]|uniref:Uncharacterized protein n=1 Tax=Liparis tanakae TaxID=230148 RepID=A0A4Z2HA51_9TELE|nr:hypothetical protein EYF80_027003 [Liparis tanakae]
MEAAAGILTSSAEPPRRNMQPAEIHLDMAEAPVTGVPVPPVTYFQHRSSLLQPKPATKMPAPQDEHIH